jgi:hypothetical protein
VLLRDTGGKPLYVKHEDADVVALYVSMPDDLNVPILPIDLLASDDLLQKFEIHPGDELLRISTIYFLRLWISHSSKWENRILSRLSDSN